MKRSLATTLVSSVASAAVCAGKSKESCPCFTAQEYDKIFAANPQFGCHFTGEEYQDLETISLGVAYVWPEEQALGVLQAAVTVKEINGNYVEGGVCAVAGNKINLSIKTKLSGVSIEIKYHSEGV